MRDEYPADNEGDAQLTEEVTFRTTSDLVQRLSDAVNESEVFDHVDEYLTAATKVAVNMENFAEVAGESSTVEGSNSTSNCEPREN